MSRPLLPAQRLGAALLAVATFTTVQAAALPGHADAATARPRITVTASDGDVASGQQLTLSGRLTRAGQALAGEVSVWTRTGGAWRPLTGAVVHTTRTGAYQVRVVLSATGDRELKVVGDPDRAGLRHARAITPVMVR